MGQDKALISVQGEPMLHRVARVASRCCRQIWILCPWPERYAAVVDPAWSLLREDHPDQGPLVGFHQGLTQVSSRPDAPEWILVLACDLPFLQERILGDWMGRLAGIGADRLALVPYRQDRWEPLCGWYRLSCLSSLEAAIQAGERSFQVWLEQIPVQKLQITSAHSEWDRMLWNCNTPSDLERLDLD